MVTIARMILIAVSILFVAGPAVGQWEHLGPVQSYEADGAVLTVKCSNGTVRLYAVSEHVVRVRLGPGGEFGRDFSWAVTDLAPKGRFASVTEGDGVLRATTGGVSVVIRRDPCRLEIMDGKGRVLVTDDPDRGMAWRKGSEGTRPVRVWQRLEDGVAVAGLGEKSGPMNKRNQAVTMWNTDACAYGPSSDPLYKSIPFFMASRGGVYHGVFFDNPWRTSFDFGKEDRNGLSFGAEGGELNYYVIEGPTPKEIVSRYTELTGRLELPPKWSLGYHQCRHSYFPESRVREIAEKFREKRIPCDVVYYDIAYMDDFHSFTWDAEKFPDPAKLNADLHEMGFHTVAILDPGIANEPGHFVFDSGEKIGAWLTRPDGSKYVGRVWPPKTVFPDFTRGKVRSWWSDLVGDFVTKYGVDGIWNDMNEPANFDGPNGTVPLDLRHDNEGEPASHLACHNVYGMQMARASMEGMRQARHGQRAFNLTRATYAGGQRYGAGWTGDNTSTWQHMEMSISMVLGLGVSGMPFTGPDIGGYVIGADAEMFGRWIQFGSLLPFSRTHTCWECPDQEPWSYGEDVEVIAKRAIERRYELLPYIYTLFEEASRTGVPVVRPVWMEFPGFEPMWSGRVFMLGSELLVVPRLEPASREYQMTLPPGDWFDFNTGERIADGKPATIWADEDVLPMFVRAGAIIPMQSVVQNTGEAATEPLILDVWPSGRSSGTLYEDDGISLGYAKGEYRRTDFRCEVMEEELVLTMEAGKGRYAVGERSPLVRLHGLPRPVNGAVCKVGDGKMTFTTRVAGEDSGVPLPSSFYQDRASGVWLVRMAKDNGIAQRLRVGF